MQHRSKGVYALPLSELRSGFSVLKNPANTFSAANAYPQLRAPVHAALRSTLNVPAGRGLRRRPSTSRRV
jgi:hypothetical protein